jgi:hypothetical protein
MSKEATPLPISEMDKAQRAATKDYCTNTEFKCLLDGGDPKATIYNLRAMAFSCGFEKGAEYSKSKAIEDALDEVLQKAKEVCLKEKYLGKSHILTFSDLYDIIKELKLKI